VAKVNKPKSGKAQHTWKVMRMNNQSVDVTADDLAVADGDLVFSADDVIVRIIAANTYTDVELLDAQTGTAAAAEIFQNRPAARARR
jgi:phage baseplate assembly protein gpV